MLKPMLLAVATLVISVPAFAQECLHGLGGHPKPAIDGHLKTGHHA